MFSVQLEHNNMMSSILKNFYCITIKIVFIYFYIKEQKTKKKQQQNKTLPQNPDLAPCQSPVHYSQQEKS